MGGIEDLIIQRIISSITWANISWFVGIFLILILALKSWAKRWWFRRKWRPTDEELVHLLELIELEKVGGRRFGDSLALRNSLLSRGVTKEALNEAGLPVIVVSDWAKRKLKGYSANRHRVH